MTDSAKKKPRNALVHGLYAKDVLLPWDSREDFERLHDELKVEFSPRGRAEEEAVLDLALLHWEKQTVWRLRLTTILSDPFTQDILQTEGKSWVRIRKGLRAAARDERTLLGRAEANFNELHADLQRLHEKICNASEKEEIKILDQKLATCLRILNEYAGPLLQNLMEGPNPEKAF